MAGLAVVISLSAQRGYKWYQSRPKPVEMSVRLGCPEPTRQKTTPNPTPCASSLAAQLRRSRKMKKPVTAASETESAVPGTWRWDSDRVLTFHQGGLADWRASSSRSIAKDCSPKGCAPA